MKESDFQSKLIKKLSNMFSGCIVIKNDPNYIQGLPDLTILYKDKWATLEVKKDAKAKRQPNQAFYVNRMNEMSYSSFVYPENEEEILRNLSNHFAE